eukprot:Rhum_TRINITY_DN15231_c0_g1::Rhum_TRINITY_DN15231_c0_g1_i3::g.146023::m.146023
MTQPALRRAGVLRAERAQGLAHLPHLLVRDLRELHLQLRTVVRLAVQVDRAARLLAVLHAVVALLHHRLDRVVELRRPVQRTALRGRAAVRVHPVHAVLGHQRVQRAQGLLDRLVVRLRRAVAVLAQHLVLREEGALQHAHQHAALARQVARHLLLERRLEQVSAADGHADGDRAVARAARGVLVHGEGAVDAAALEEVLADGVARALRRAQDHVDVLARHDARLLVVHDAEAVAEVQGLARRHVRLHAGPRLDLGGVGEQVLHDGRVVRGLVDVEQVLARHPSVALRLLEGLALAHADHHVQAVVLHVQRLAAALRAVAEHGQGLVLQRLLHLRDGEVAALDDRLLDAVDVDHGLQQRRAARKGAAGAGHRGTHHEHCV